MAGQTLFGAELTALRLERGLSLRALALLAGVSQGHLSNVSGGTRGLGSPPTDELVERLAAALGVDPAEAFSDYRRRRAVEKYPDAIDKLYRRRQAS